MKSESGRGRLFRFSWRLCWVAIAAIVLPESVVAVTPVISAGRHYRNTCAVNSAGAVSCWGDDGYGQVGDSSALLSTTAVKVAGSSSTLTSIASGEQHACALTASGAVLCWGDNFSGQLGNGTTTGSSVPGAVGGLPPQVGAIAAGQSHTCALTTAGGVFCWGWNGFGQLGNASAGGGVPGAVASLTSGVTAISVRGNYSCAISTTRGVLCWGANYRGQLGNGTTANGSVPVSVVGLPPGVAAISAGVEHACALTAAGAVFCWGKNDSGQLGNGTTTSSLVPVPVNGLSSGVAAISAGDDFACAVTTTRSLVCWGGGAASSLVPTPVASLSGSTLAVSAGHFHSCAITSSRDVECWGLNNVAGQLGNATTTGSSVPVRVTGLPSPASAISLGRFHSCALTIDGAAYCWGGNTSGQLGNGRSLGFAVPKPVAALSSGVVSVSAGGTSACALTAAGSVSCWGLLPGGFQGNAVVPVPGLSSGITAISDGGGTACALTLSGGVLCWGVNQTGNLGNGTAGGGFNANPVQVIGLASGVTAISTSAFHSCALTASGTVYCWGWNFSGPVGDSSTWDTVPKPVQGLSGVVAISTAFSETCALTGAGQVLCWGLGDRLVPTPTPVAGLPPGTVAISTGIDHTCALTSVGAAWCWGGNANGQLGNGSTLASTTPVPVAGLSSGVRAITAGEYYSCALTNDELTLCWGFNDYGELGDGTFANRTTPVVVRREDGSGSIAAGDWYLDLDPSIRKVVPPDKTPAFAVATSGGVTEAIANVVTNARFRSTDVGKSIYVFAYAAAPKATLAKDGPTCVLSQLGPSGLLPVSASNLGSLLGSVTTTAQQAVTILDNVPTSQVAGATFCVGTGSTGTESTAPGNNVCVATVPGAGVCLPPDGSVAPPAPGPVSTATSLVGPSASIQGAPVTFIATVAGTSPSGTVQFKDGATNLGAAVALSNGTASLSVDTLVPGSHSIAATYSGDAGNAASTSNAIALTVYVAAAITLATSPDPSIEGSSVTLTANVTGGINPTGTVTFKDGGVTLATASLAGGSASAIVATLAAGTHTLTADYSGDGNNGSATSPPVSQVVNALASGPLLLSAAPLTLDFGDRSMDTTSPPLSVAVTNTSGASVTVTAVTPPSGFSIASNDCVTVAPGATCHIAVTFTPIADAAYSGLLSIAYAGGGPTTVSLAGSGEKSLATHYYRSILRRDPDAGGKQFWDAEAARMQSLGVNPSEAWRVMAMAFYGSTEYQALGRDDTGYITDLYETFFNRAPDAAGLAYWSGQMASGMSREVALPSFLFSQEFSSFMQQVFGNAAARAESDTVVDFYRGLLGRLPDDAGFGFWLQRFRAAECLGSSAVYDQVEAISSAFSTGAEYASRNRSNAQFMGDIYNAFLRRGADLAGVQYWIGQLDSGAVTREDVRKAFLTSPEFSARVAAMIAEPCLP